MAMRGIQLIAATVLISELGDLRRFAHPRQLMDYLGLVSREESTGDRQHRGAITKCGNTHARWFLIECAQHYALPPKVSKELSKRQEHQSQGIKQLSWKSTDPAASSLLCSDATQPLPAESSRGRGP